LDYKVIEICGLHGHAATGEMYLNTGCFRRKL